MFADTWGIPRGKRLPAKQFLKSPGFAIANVAYTWDVHSFIFPTEFVNDTHGYPDMHAAADLSTFHVAGWRDGTAYCICNTFDVETHEPVALDGRHILRRAVERIEDRATSRSPRPSSSSTSARTTGSPTTRAFTAMIVKGAEVEDVVGDIRRALDVSGIEVEACNVEYGPAQVEVNLLYGSASRWPTRPCSSSTSSSRLRGGTVSGRRSCRSLHGRGRQRDARPPEPRP